MKRVRRPARARGASPRRETDWISFFLDDVDGVAVGGAPMPQQQYALVDPTDMLVKDGKVTVERVVGDFLVAFPRDAVGADVVPALMNCFWGLIVQDVDETGAILAVDPETSNGLESQWMAMGHFVASGFHALVGPPPVLMKDFAVWQHIDVHVRRKMTERQVLLLYLGASPLVGPGTIIASAFLRLRTLVKLT